MDMRPLFVQRGAMIFEGNEVIQWVLGLAAGVTETRLPEHLRGLDWQ